MAPSELRPFRENQVGPSVVRSVKSANAEASLYAHDSVGTLHDVRIFRYKGPEDASSGSSDLRAQMKTGDTTKLFSSFIQVFD